MFCFSFLRLAYIHLAFYFVHFVVFLKYVDIVLIVLKFCFVMIVVLLNYNHILAHFCTITHTDTITHVN